MCKCEWCGDCIEGPVAMIGGTPMHEHCCAEYNAELYPENGDSWECDDILYGPEDEDFEEPGYEIDPAEYEPSDDPFYRPYDDGCWDDGQYDDDPNPYCGY